MRTEEARGSRGVKQIKKVTADTLKQAGVINTDTPRTFLEFDNMRINKEK